MLLITRVFQTEEDDESSTCSFDYMNIFLSTLAEGFGVLVAAGIIDGWGRKPSQVVFFVLGGIAVLLMPLKLPSSGLMLCAMVARMSAMIASCAAWVAAPELFPTEMRYLHNSFIYDINYKLIVFDIYCFLPSTLLIERLVIQLLV